MNLNKLIEFVKDIFFGISDGIKSRTIDTIEAELKDMEGAFGLLLFGSLIGMPIFSSFVGVSLLPYIEREIITMLSRSKMLDDFASYWFEIADI